VPVLRCRSRCNNRWTLWTQRNAVDDLADANQLRGLQPNRGRSAAVS
jgi:hypothetical protein